MINVFGQIKSSFAVYSALLITLMSRVKAHNCSESQFQNCMSTLANITDSRLTFASNKTELEKICPDMRKSVRCIHHYTKSCWTFEQHRHFDRMFRNTAHMVHELCSNEHYQAVFLKHTACMAISSADHTLCVNRYSRFINRLQESEPKTAENGLFSSKKRREASDERIRSVCCAFRDYIDCSSTAMRRKCGEEAASFSREFLRNMSSTMMEYCAIYDPQKCETYSSATGTTYSLISLALLSVIALFLS